MTERDFDHIFRRKMEQISPPSPDENIWQSIDSQLDNKMKWKRNIFQTALLLLLLFSLLSNFFFWKKLNTDNVVYEKKSTFVNDTIISKTYINVFDTIVKNVYVTRKTFINQSNDSEIFSKNDNRTHQSSTTFSKNNNEIASANNSETANKLAINDQKQLNDDKINKKEIEVELTTDITKKDADQLKDTLFKSNSLTPKKPNEQVNNSKENQETDIIPLPKNVIKPVKEKKMTDWTVGIVGLRGYLKGSTLRGEYGGVGLSVTTNYKTKWRINSSLDYTTMEYEDDEDSEYHTKHPKPKVNPQDSFTRWTAEGQPFSQISFGLDRIFTYKKLQTYLGIGTGVNIILPYTIRYEVRDDCK